MKASHKKLVKKTMGENPTLMAKILIEYWNAETPHFGGVGPHRYNGKETKCCYCNRPKSWKPVNAGYACSFFAEEA